MKNSRLDILSRPVFILALVTLLLNDFYLKYAYSNFLTGKFSDFAGLFLFPYLLSSIRIKFTKSIYLGTALLFIFWKSSFSQEVINWWQVNGIGFNRVVDYTDLLALFILPFSFSYFQKQLSTEHRISKVLILPIGMIGLFAIWATTLPKNRVHLNLKMDATYKMQMSKEELFKSMQVGHGYSDTLEKNLKDSLFYVHFDIVDGHRIDLTALVTITSIDSNRTDIRLDKILHGDITGGLFSGVDNDTEEHFKSISAKDLKILFESNFIQPIKNGKSENICYDNKEIYDSFGTSK